MEVLIFRVTVCDDEAFKAITKCDCCHEALNFGVTVCGDEAVKAVTKGDCRHVLRNWAAQQEVFHLYLQPLPIAHITT